VVEVHPGDRAGRADAGGVAHDLAALIARESAEVEGVYVPVVLLYALLEVRNLGGVEEPLVVHDDPALAEFVQVLRERLDLFVPVDGLFLRVAGERVAEREQEVVAVPAGFHRIRRRSDLGVGVAPRIRDG